MRIVLSLKTAEGAAAEMASDKHSVPDITIAECITALSNAIPVVFPNTIPSHSSFREAAWITVWQ
jgi:hypothetical protein